MAKKSKNKGAGAKRKELDEPIVTMKALQEMSDSDDEELPPESEWNKDAKALKETIERGTFDVLLKQSAVGGGSDEESFEEVDLDDDDYDESSNGSVEEEADTANDSSAAKTSKKDEEIEMADDNDADDSAGPSDQEEEASGDERAASEGEEEDDEGAASEGEEDDDEEDEDEESENDEEDEKSSTIKEKNTVKAKALQVVAEALIAEKKQWPWAETFDIIPVDTPLPFHGDDALNIHDDLKREVAFYDMALQAVLEAKEKCKEAGVPFSRPEDFFAEMVKTDEHMAKVKDRLIFENKKMEAVAQRKSNKEQKLRAKESQSNKLAEKAKKKKDHFKAVEEWAQTAAANRGRGRLADNDNGEAFFNNKASPNNKKRQFADKKYGHGGKRGRFKQNDPKALNDMSGYNRQGNFGGMGTKKSASKTGAGANRKGKRARDASRSR